MKKASEISKKVLFKMTKGQDRQPLSSLKGEQFEPEAYCLYSYTNSDGEVVDGLSLLINGEVYMTSSDPVINSFNAILDTFEGEDVTLTLVSKTSKSGREYNFLDVVI